MYMYIYCTVKVRLKVSEKSFFPTSFGLGRFQGNLFSFEKTNESGYKRFYLTPDVCGYVIIPFSCKLQ